MRALAKGLKTVAGRVFLQANWLTRGRALAYCRIFGLYGWGLFLSIIVVSHGGKNFEGLPICSDFVSFWAASSQVLHGHSAEVYDAVKHHQAELAAFSDFSFGNFAFYYPPTFLLVCLPLALAPYRLSLAVFLILTAIAFVGALRRLLPQRWALMPILAFPGLVIGVANGQNGLLTGALFGWAMVLMRARPFLAGLCLGCLVIKPQLLVAAPLVLLCARRWWAIAGGLCSGSMIFAVSWVVFGSSGWNGFFHMSHEARVVFEHGYVQAWKMQSVYAAVNLLCGREWLAYAVQGMATVMALSLAGWLAARSRALPRNARSIGAPEMAVMIAAMPFCSPFLLDYDVACLAFPLGWVLLQARDTGWWSGEKFVLFVTYAYLLGARLFGGLTHIGPTPLVATALLFVVARRIAPREWLRLRHGVAQYCARGGQKEDVLADRNPAQA
ncbi:glycosyltransferase family 87 protein [Acetobacter conturbans]|uniref:DUF2029 domain-containing protein n=1 Tax=Acetobacter conturbans TaxID=1737472 RepID=A0ABX0K103_9PROT|nr:glycosyltransferase family 87 protein [Acetobacter conturbans]NHN89276.1 DUF2029 domain-containing protein [Acetobacter conturbans]